MKEDLRIQNKNIIDMVIGAGADTEKPHIIEFSFYGDISKLGEIKRNLLSLGYIEVLGQSENIDDLTVSRNLSLDIDLISNEELRMIDIAKEFGVSYDGWSTYPVK